MSGLHNLMRTWLLADAIDRDEGKYAYRRYNMVLHDFAEYYGTDFTWTVYAFVALSPNNDYYGNLRSLVSLLDGKRKGKDVIDLTVSTYNHCRDRAYGYLHGRPFEAEGLKIVSFAQNILDPLDPKPVTIDGHIVALWRDQPNATMKDSIVRRPRYMEIAGDIRLMASIMGLIPNQVQATLWFTRKRIHKIKYDGQMRLFTSTPSDLWRVIYDPRDVKPYARKELVHAI